MNPNNFPKIVQLRDGTLLTIRPLLKNDEKGLLEYMKQDLNSARITCRLKNGVEVTLPVAGCSDKTKKLACQKKYGFTGEVLDCKK